MERLLNFRNEKLYFLWWKQENGGGERVNDVEEGRQAGFLVSNAELDSCGTDQAPKGPPSGCVPACEAAL